VDTHIATCISVHISVSELVDFGTCLAVSPDMERKPDAQGGDRHSSGFMLRLPEIFRTKLRLLKQKTGKPMTELVGAALKLLLRQSRMWQKEDERDWITSKWPR
jgi:hypothetical protein